MGRQRSLVPASRGSSTTHSQSQDIPDLYSLQLTYLLHVLSPVSASLPLLQLTQIKSVVPVDLHPERVHPGVPLGVRVPQHLAVQVHDFLALSLRVLRHVYRKVQKGGGLAGDTVLPGGHGSWGIRSAAI